MKLFLSFGFRSCFLAVLSLFLAASLQAEVRQGKAVVTAVKGSVTYSYNNAIWKTLKRGDVLKPGATVKTGDASSVDLFLDQNGQLLALNPNSILNLEKLNYEESLTGQMTVDTLLDLRDGDLIGKAARLSQGSKYQVRTANGIANIGGSDVQASWDPEPPPPFPSGDTHFYISFTKGTVHVLEGCVRLIIQLNFTNFPFPTQTFLDIQAGQSGFIPKKPTHAQFHSLAPVTSPNPLTGLSKFTEFNFANTDKITVFMNMDAKLIVNRRTGVVRKQIKFPPDIEILSP
jgi:hypothetical protein